MNYSRKRYWFALAMALVVALACVLILHAYPIAMAAGVATACGLLGFTAYFSLDEIQRRNEMRAWYHGGLLAVLFALVPMVVLMSNAMVEAMAALVPHSGRVPHGPKAYFGLGVASALVVQAIGHFIAHAVFKISGRARA